MHNFLFTVIIPCYNIADYIDICVENIIKQTIGFQNIQIIFIDDLSDDESTLVKLREYEKKYTDNIVLIESKEKHGAGGSRNIALPYVMGEYIAYCDGDDWFDVNAFKILYDIAKKNNADVVEFGYHNIDIHNGQSDYISSQEANVIYTSMDSFEDRRSFVIPDDYEMICCNKIYRSEIIINNKISFAENVIYEEPPFSYILKYYIERYCRTDLKLYYYYKRLGSDSKKYYSRLSDSQISYDLMINDLKSRGFYELFNNEIDYIFWCGSYYLPLFNMAKSGNFCDSQYYENRRKHTVSQISDIRKNPYFVKDFSEIKIIGDISYIDVDKVGYEDIKELFTVITH